METDGGTYTSADTTFRGEQDDPFSDAQVTRKFRWLTADTLAPERVAAVEALVSQIDTVADITALVNLLSPAPESP